MGAKATFAERFFDLCKDKTQQELSNDLGISRQTIGFYMNGDRSPDIENLSKIASYFGVSADYLIGLSDHTTAEKADIGETLGLSEQVIELLTIHDKSAFPTVNGYVLSNTKCSYSRQFLNIFMPCVSYFEFAAKAVAVSEISKEGGVLSELIRTGRLSATTKGLDDFVERGVPQLEIDCAKLNFQEAAMKLINEILEKGEHNGND